MNVVPLAERRPASVLQQIESQYEYAITMAYGNRGRESEYTHRDGVCPVSTTDLVNRLSGNLGRTFRILDIGCGAGGVILRQLQSGHDAIGVTARDYRDDASRHLLPDARYVLGNVCYLSELVEGPFDLIVSRRTFEHIPDPLGVYEIAANMLSDGGIIAVDRALPYIPTALPHSIYRAADAATDLERAGFSPVDMYARSVANLCMKSIVRREGQVPVSFQAEFGDYDHLFGRVYTKIAA